MFERFTDRARRVVVLAQEEARGLSHNYIGTEHILLGLIREEEGMAAQTLRELGMGTDDTRQAIKDMVGVGTEPPKGHIPFTPRSKTVLEMSLRAALRLGHNYIGTEHILFAVVEEAGGVAAQVLMRKVDGGLDVVRRTLLTSMEGLGTVTEEMVARVREGLRPREVVEKGESTGDEVVKRLEAIEARLSAIERLLRGREEDAS